MSNPGIFLIQPNDDLVEMSEINYEPEEVLQKLLADYPSLLAGNQINPKAPRKWLFIERESGIPSEKGGSDRFSADHLFLDQDAIPTIVEVKRSSDTRIRREVVGQMLDYAANAVEYWPPGRIRERFAVTCKDRGQDPAQKVLEFLGEDFDSEEFWKRADTNLLEGNMRLIFVADSIPPELQRIVEFLRRQMQRPEVLAFEIKQFVGQGLKVLVPRVVGQILPPVPPPPPPVRTPEQIIEAIREISNEEAEMAQQMLE